MTRLAPILEGFFTERLITQRHASPHTIAAYRDTFRLLLTYIRDQAGTKPSDLTLDQLDAPLIGAFLTHLERDRGVTARTRNARLTAIRSLFTYASYRHPDHAELIARVLSIPAKNHDRSLVQFLTDVEMDALLAAPDQTTRLGRRDHALLATALQTGLRVSELAGLTRGDVHLNTGPHVRCTGKGRRERITPLTRRNVDVLSAWLRECPGLDTAPLFPGPRGGPLGRNAIRRVVNRHARTATRTCPSLAGKTVSPHTLRHTTAMRLLQAGVDTTVIALWLGHEHPRTTLIYLHADLAMKERALARTAPPSTAPGRYRPDDELLAFLVAL